jgi:hypothetical protein
MGRETVPIVTALVADLKDNFRRRVGKGHRAEVLRLLRGQDESQAKLAAFPQQFLNGRSRIEG